MKLAEIFTNYFQIRKELIEGVKNLTREQLEWTPEGHTNSIGKLLAHIAEAEYWWIYVVAEANIKQADADSSVFEKPAELSQILTWLDEYHNITRGYLEREDLENWDDISYLVEWRKEHITKRDLVWHVVEHQARHRGQIFMLMRMQGLEVPRV